MITGKLKSDIDKLWEEFWTGGITNPLTVIEQVSFLMFARLLDVTETKHEARAARTKKPFKAIFGPKEQDLRWSHFKHLKAEKMLEVVRDKVFPHFRHLNGGTTFGEYMADAQLMVQKPNLLVSAVNMIDALPITEGDAKGDLYEYLLSKLTTAGINGQFRTPRHIIRFMAEMLDPKPTETVGDPACGTAGFLVGTMQYLNEKYSSPIQLNCVLNSPDVPHFVVEFLMFHEMLHADMPSAGHNREFRQRERAYSPSVEALEDAKKRGVKPGPNAGPDFWRVRADMFFDTFQRYYAHKRPGTSMEL